MELIIHDLNIYEDFGFRKVRCELPDYRYILNNKRIDKLTTKKEELSKIYDCGRTRFER